MPGPPVDLFLCFLNPEGGGFGGRQPPDQFDASRVNLKSSIVGVGGLVLSWF